MSVKGNEERRRSPRFDLRERVFANVKADGEALGEIMNVSEGGIALKYLADNGPAVGRATLDIFESGRMVLSNVPARTVSDMELPNDFDFSTIELRRMGVAFEHLTQAQRQTLQGFIQEKRV